MKPPTPEIYRGWHQEIDEFLRRINQAHHLVPMGATSWWRDYYGNLSAGGNEYSQHLIATAADVYPLYGSLDDVEWALRRSGLIPARGYRSHVHAQLFPAGFLQRWALS